MTDWSLEDRFIFEGEAVACGMIGSGPPLVMIHGTPFSSYVWRSIARELARSHTVHLYDLVGYGQSEKREGQDVSLARQGRLLAALLGHWGLTGRTARRTCLPTISVARQRCAPISCTAATIAG